MSNERRPFRRPQAAELGRRLVEDFLFEPVAHWLSP
jgi:hypothetical protein